MFRSYNNLISFLDPFLGTTDCDAEVTLLDVTDLGAEVCAPLTARGWHGTNVAELGAMIHGAELLSPTAVICAPTTPRGVGSYRRWNAQSPTTGPSSGSPLGALLQCSLQGLRHDNQLLPPLCLLVIRLAHYHSHPSFPLYSCASGPDIIHVCKIPRLTLLYRRY